ncbi:hypothetical protein Ddye_004388 [Dipteronia dyeriana]|uniref:Uncharacterized protein n=1 Tax=Dipteronia dyeriana TaxID=168575 RepID=A0AAE0CWC0_9ROSI|nr:hypothetical protein Ddye_004388 [Dipteronia dyeriana]
MEFLRLLGLEEQTLIHQPGRTRNALENLVFQFESSPRKFVSPWKRTPLGQSSTTTMALSSS